MFEKDDDFREFYESALKYKYEELYWIRLKYLIIFFSPIALYVVLYMIGLLKADDFLWYGICACFFCSIPAACFKSATKQKVMNKILKFFGDFDYFQNEELISKKYVEESGLVGENVIEQTQEDSFKGKYNNVEIVVSEQSLSGNLQNFNNYSFAGVLIALKYNKKYKGKIKVFGQEKKTKFSIKEIIFLIVVTLPIFFLVMNAADDKYFYFVLFVIYAFICSVFWKIRPKVRQKDEERKQVCLEDVVFSKKWKVYADDQVEARYVLTPALMEKMLAVKKMFHGYRIDFSFWENNLLIAVHTNKDMFETTSLFRSTLSYRKVREVYYQLQSIFSLIVVLKLGSNRKESEG